jgi:CHASE3 domain sensor protein
MATKAAKRIEDIKDTIGRKREAVRRLIKESNEAKQRADEAMASLLNYEQTLTAELRKQLDEVK